jgi:diaminopropionate ammonia-lyase
MHGTVTVEDAEAHAAMRDLAAAGLAIGESGAAPLAGLRRLATDPRCAALREHVRLGADSRVLLIATEGPTDPVAYQRAVGTRLGQGPPRSPQPRTARSPARP